MTQRYSRFFKRIMDDFFRDFSGLGNPILLIAIFSLVMEGNSLLRAIIGLLSVMFVCYAIKLFFHKDRPEKMEHVNWLESVQSRSFPSVHSAMAMYFGLAIIKTADNIIIDVIFIMIIIIVGYSRYYLKKHYIGDIIGGYAIGLGVYFIVF